jgi:hypothetical protein
VRPDRLQRLSGRQTPAKKNTPFRRALDPDPVRRASLALARFRSASSRFTWDWMCGHRVEQFVNAWSPERREPAPAASRRASES